MREQFWTRFLVTSMSIYKVKSYIKGYIQNGK